MHRSMPAALQSKLFILESHGEDDVQWVEQATGIPSFFKEENSYKLTFKSEDENLPFLYELTVNDNVNFDRTEAKIITWTVIKQNVEAALSFRDQGGANSFWYLIDEYQKKDSVQVQSGTKDHFVIEFRIGDPTKTNLSTILKQLQDIPYIQKRERISSIFLTKIDLLPSLKKLFFTLQQQGVQKNKQYFSIFFQIMKILLNFGDCQLITELLSEPCWKFTFGALQYDPQFFRYPHRNFMQKQAKFLQVVPIKNPDRLRLIHLTYRLQYVKQCILAAHLDETGLRTHTMIILANYKDILNFIFSPREKQYLNQIFNGLRNQDPKVYKLLSEICKIARNIDIFYGTVQQISKDVVFASLQQKEIFQILIENITTNFSNKQKVQVPKQKSKSKIRSAEDLVTVVKVSIQVLILSLQVNPSFFKDYCYSQNQKTLKFPVLNFLFQKINDIHIPEWQSFNKIIAILNDQQFHHPINSLIQKMSIDLILKDNINYASAIEILNKLCETSSPQLFSRLDQIISKMLVTLIPLSKSKNCLRVTILQSFKKLISSCLPTNKKIVLQSLLINIHFMIQLLKQTKAKNSMQLSVILETFRTLVKNHHQDFLLQIINSLQAQKTEICYKLIKDINHVINYKENQEFHFKRQKSDIRLGQQTFEVITHNQPKGQ